MAGGKKSKSEGKKAKAVEKKQKQEKKGQKKKNAKTAKLDDSDVEEDIDLEAILAGYARQQEQFLQVTEERCDPPKPRASSVLIASPSHENEVFLFGGEYFDGTLATFYNDLFVYSTQRNDWRAITSPNTPLPRSGHAMCRGGNAGGIYMFGGEFSSPKQGTFYHYNDFWHFEPSSREWTRLESKGKGPSARSGHRMTYFKNYIILFGGFQDASQQTKYLADLWIYNTNNFTWHTPTLPLATQKPEARSSFSFLPHASGAVLYGGYSRVNAISTGGQKKGGGQRTIQKPMVHQDCFFLRFNQPALEAPLNTLPTVRWERRKRPANVPNPPRAGATMTFHKGRGVCFGGVHDVEQREDGIESEFFNTLSAWNIERNRFFPLSLRKTRATQQKRQAEGRAGRRGRADANEEELLRNLAALENGKSLADVEDTDIDIPDEAFVSKKTIDKELLMEFPHPRFNAQLAVQADILYIYGGTLEQGDREYTFDDLYAVDLGKLDGVHQLFRREPANWQGSEDEISEDEDGSGEASEDTDESEAENIEIADDKLKISESKRKSNTKVESIPFEDVQESSSTTTFDDAPDNTKIASALDDNLPHPRPFESRREFFQRTGNEWQDALMASWTWKGLQPEAFSVKEIKTRAFEMSEEKWWDSREEVTNLESEQEAAGIGDVVTVADRSEIGGGGSMGRRR